MGAQDLPRAIAAAYAWHRALGSHWEDTGLGRFVVDPTRPMVWDANHVSRVTASSTAEMDRLLEEMEARFAHCAHRVVATDPFTPPSVSARLMLESYDELTPVVHLVLTGDIATKTAPALRFRPVLDEADWRDLHELVLADRTEGLSTGRTSGDEDVTRGLVQGYRNATGPCLFFIAEREGAPCGYASAIRCPDGDLGMVEDVFTLPEVRGQGIATALIDHCVRHARAEGAGPVFIGAHANDWPKHLYARLGFRPVLVTRKQIKATAAAQSEQNGRRP